MTIRFGEYKKRDISFLLNFVANLFLYYTGYRQSIHFSLVGDSQCKFFQK